METSFQQGILNWNGSSYTLGEISEQMVFSLELTHPDIANEVINAKAKSFGSSMMHRGESRTVSNPLDPEELIPYRED